MGERDKLKEMVHIGRQMMRENLPLFPLPFSHTQPWSTHTKHGTADGGL